MASAREYRLGLYQVEIMRCVAKIGLVGIKHPIAGKAGFVTAN